MIVSAFGLLSYGAYAGINQNINVSNEADYTKPRTVNYYDSDGTTLLLSTKTEKGNMALKPANPIKSNSGKTSYKFDKWVTTKGGTTAADLTNITTDINVYPSFDEIDNSIDVVKVAADNLHSLALTDSGEVYSWGHNNNGQLGSGNTADLHSPTKVTVSGVKFTDIAAGGYHSLALTESGEVYSWGYNENGELGLGNFESPKTLLQKVTVSGVKFTDIKAGYNHSLALTDTGEIYLWGRNNVGQLGLGYSGTDTNKNSPQHVTKPEGVNKFTKISGGYAHSLALTDAGVLYSWGNNYYGQLGLETSGSETNEDTPQKVKVNGVKFTGIAGSEYYSLALTDTGEIYSWGNNDYGQLGLGTIEPYKLTPQKVTKPSGVSKFINIAVGKNHSLALTDTGDIYSWGKNGYGQLGLASTESLKKDPQKVTMSGVKFTGITGGDVHSLALTDKGEIYSWGGNFTGQLGLGFSGDIDKNSPQKVIENANSGSKAVFTGVKSNGYFSRALSTQGDIYTWGESFLGQLGLGVAGVGVNQTTPKKVTKPSGVTKFTVIDGGTRHSLALTDTGDIYSWGNNVYGQLGLGDSGYNTERTSPQLVTKPSAVNKFNAIAAGAGFSMALTDTGDIYSWGDNTYGQLGLGTLGTNTYQAKPQKVTKPSGVNKFIDIGAGYFQSLALTDTGDIYSWGHNTYGQLGLGNTDWMTTPQLVLKPSTVNKFTDIVGGEKFSLALTDAGEIYSWGINDAGQLGIGNSGTQETTPKKVSNPSGVTKFTSLDTSYNHSLALTDTGDSYSWGKNENGELGLGTSGTDMNKASPQKITMPDGVTKFTDISGSAFHSLALTDIGVLYSWGSNSNGELGLGTSGTHTNKTTPQRIWAIAL